MATIFKELEKDLSKMDISHDEMVENYIKAVKASIEIEKYKEELFISLGEKQKKEAQKILNDYDHNNMVFPSELSVRDVAQIMNVTTQMVRRYCAEGKLKARQRIEGSGKWFIETDQFLGNPRLIKLFEDKKEMKEKSLRLAEKAIKNLSKDN